MAEHMTTCDACGADLDKTQGFVTGSARVNRMVFLDPDEREAFHDANDEFDFPADHGFKSGGLVEGEFCDYKCAGDFLTGIEMPTVDHPRYGKRVTLPDNPGETYDSGDMRKDGNPNAKSVATLSGGDE